MSIREALKGRWRSSSGPTWPGGIHDDWSNLSGDEEEQGHRSVSLDESTGVPGAPWRISKGDCVEVTAMLMTYDRLNAGELRGSSQADYLVSLDAAFQMWEGGVVLYQETAFPVVELARSLLLWLSDPRRVDFYFESISFEEVGSVEVRRISSGWVFGSIFTPGRSSGSDEWSEVERCSLEFVSRVEDDLLGLGLDPEAVIRR